MRRIPSTLMLGLALVAATAALLLGPVRSLPAPDSAFHLPWPVLATLFAASVVLRVHLQFRREVHSVTLMEVPLVLGLHFVDPAGMVLASGTVAAVTNTSLALTTVAVPEADRQVAWLLLILAAVR
jgi:predicted transporter